MATERIDIIVSEHGSRVVKRNIDDIGGSASRSHNAVSLLRKALGGLTVGLALTSAVRTLASFSQEMSTVRAITGATEAQFKALREETKLLGATTRFSATQAAEGASFLARAGFDVNEILASLNDTLLLAQAGALDLGKAADIASNILTGFRLEASEASRVVDVLAKAANSSNTNVEQLGEGMKFVAPVAAGLGVELEEVTAAIGALSDAGLQATLAGTGLRRILSELESPSSKTQTLLAQLGLTADQVRVSQVGLTEALQRLRDAGVDTGLALEIFGDRGGPAFEVLSSSIPKVQGLTKALKESEGTARRVADIMDDNLNGAFLAVKSAAEALVIAFGELGSESILTQALNTLATALRALANNLDAISKAATIASIALAAVYGPGLLASAAAFTSRILAQVAAFFELRAAVASGNAILLGSVAAEKARGVAAAQAAVEATAANVAVMRAEAQRTAAILASTQAEAARALVVSGSAQAEFARLAVQKQIEAQRVVAAASEVALAKATNAHAAAQARLAAATTAASGGIARQITLMGLLTGATRAAAGAVTFLTAAIAANPLGALLIAVTAVITALVIFADKISLGEGRLATLADLATAVWEEISGGLSKMVSFFDVNFGFLVDIVERVFGEIEISLAGILRFWARWVDNWIGLFLGAGGAIAAAFRSIPDLVKGNTSIEELGVAVREGFLRGFNADLVEGTLDRVLNRAEELAQQRLRRQNSEKADTLLINTPKRESPFANTPGGITDFDTIVKQLRQEGELLKLNARERAIQSDLLRVQEELARDLSAPERELLTNILRTNQALNERNELQEMFRNLSREGELLQLDPRERAIQAPIARTEQQLGRPLAQGERQQLEGQLRNNQALQDADVLREAQQALEKEAELLRLNNREREVAAQILTLERQLRRDLTETERQGIAGLIETNRQLFEQAQILDQLQGPRQNLQAQQQALNTLFAEGKISLADYVAEMRKLREEMSAMENTFSGGVANGLDRLAERANNLGQQVSDWVVGSFDAAKDAIVDFAKTGEFNVRQLFSSIGEQLLRLATDQLFAQLADLLRSGAGGGAGSLGGAFASLLGFANGGSFTIGGSGGTDSQLVAFRGTPGERVDVRTPSQQKEQPAAQAPPPQIRLVNVIDPRESLAALDSAEGERVIMNFIERNPHTIRRILGAT